MMKDLEKFKTLSDLVIWDLVILQGAPSKKVFTYMFGLFKDKYKNFQNCIDYTGQQSKWPKYKNNCLESMLLR